MGAPCAHVRGWMAGAMSKNNNVRRRERGLEPSSWYNQARSLPTVEENVNSKKIKKRRSRAKGSQKASVLQSVSPSNPPPPSSSPFSQPPVSVQAVPMSANKSATVQNAVTDDDIPDLIDYLDSDTDSESDSEFGIHPYCPQKAYQASFD